MTHQWTVKGKRPITAGHGETEHLVKLECPEIPCTVYVGECWDNPDVQEALAQHIAEFLSK